MALTDAGNRPGADTIRVGAGTVSSTGGFNYQSGFPVEIDGAGSAATTLTTSSSTSGVTILSSPSGPVSLSGVTVRLGPGSNDTGLALGGAGNLVDGVAIGEVAGPGIKVTTVKAITIRPAPRH